MKADDILSRFDGAEEDADGYVVRCPAHRDGRPSLKIWFDSTKCRMTCRAGCKTADVLKAAGLKWADLFDVTGAAVTVPERRSELVSGAPVARLAMYMQECCARLTASSTASDVYRYAARRFGVTADIAAELKLGFDPGVGFQHTSRGYERFPRLTVPLADFRGIVKGLQGRDISGQCPGRWLSLSNPDGQRWLPYGVFRPAAETMLITEGPGDGLSAVSAVPTLGAVVIRGASLAKNEWLLSQVVTGLRGKTVILAGDNDKAGAGFNGAPYFALVANGVTPNVVQLPRRYGDVTQWRESDPGGFAESFVTAVETARALPRKTNKARDKRLSAYLSAVLEGQ